MAGPVA
jgi:restriction system protein